MHLGVVVSAWSLEERPLTCSEVEVQEDTLLSQRATISTTSSSSRLHVPDELCVKCISHMLLQLLGEMSKWHTALQQILRLQDDVVELEDDPFQEAFPKLVYLRLLATAQKLSHSTHIFDHIIDGEAHSGSRAPTHNYPEL